MRREVAVIDWEGSRRFVGRMLFLLQIVACLLFLVAQIVGQACGFLPGGVEQWAPILFAWCVTAITACGAGLVGLFDRGKSHRRLMAQRKSRRELRLVKKGLTMHRLKLGVAGRAVVLCVLILPFPTLAIWRWFAQDYLGATLMVTSICLFLHAIVSRLQYHCRRLFRWHDRLARYGREAAASLRRRAEPNAACTLDARGVRARDYFREHAERLSREAERHEVEAACHERERRWWDFLQ